MKQTDTSSTLEPTDITFVTTSHYPLVHPPTAQWSTEFPQNNKGIKKSPKSNQPSPHASRASQKSLFRLQGKLSSPPWVLFSFFSRRHWNRHSSTRIAEDTKSRRGNRGKSLELRKVVGERQNCIFFHRIQYASTHTRTHARPMAGWGVGEVFWGREEEHLRK